MPAKDLIFDAEARRQLKSGIDALANAVKVTLGPRGRNVAIDKKWGAPTVTHDGVTVAKEIELSMSVVNWGEVYYSTWHEYGREAAIKVEAQIVRLPIEIVDADRENTRLAASLKAETKLPYADSFAAALSKLRDAALATADADFDVVSDQIVLLRLP